MDRIQVERIIRAVELYVPCLDEKLIEALDRLKEEVRAA